MYLTKRRIVTIATTTIIIGNLLVINCIILGIVAVLRIRIIIKLRYLHRHLCPSYVAANTIFVLIQIVSL
jgi:hypothetical protein